MTPQLLITLDPETGQLQAELPGTQATRRKLPIKVESAGEIIKRILEAQLGDRTEIGTDGAPTRAQLKHWEDHGTWPSERCRFCLAEGLIKPSAARVRRAYSIERRTDGVEIRRIRAGASSKHKVLITKKSTEEMDL